MPNVFGVWAYETHVFQSSQINKYSQVNGSRMAMAMPRQNRSQKLKMVQMLSISNVLLFRLWDEWNDNRPWIHFLCIERFGIVCYHCCGWHLGLPSRLAPGAIVVAGRSFKMQCWVTGVLWLEPGGGDWKVANWFMLLSRRIWTLLVYHTYRATACSMRN